jgi:uncharacterized peroxidase-related enzyme
VPLITPLSPDHDPALQELATFFQGTLGFIPNSVLTMQHRPAIAMAFIELNKAVMHNEGRLTSEQKRLVALVSSATTGCRYCQAHTALAAQRFGASSERLEAIWSFQDSPLFIEAEKVAFDYALAASSVPNAVDADLHARLKEYWDDGEIVELTAVIALFGFLNRWNDSMATTLEPQAASSAVELLSGTDWTSGRHQ